MRTRNPVAAPAAPKEVFGATVSAPSFLSPVSTPSGNDNIMQPLQGEVLGGIGMEVHPGKSISQYLQPFLQQVQQQNFSEMQGRIEPYISEVQEVTDRTFPDAFSNLGSGVFSGLGNNQLSNPFGALGGILGGMQPRPASDIGSNSFVQGQANPSPYQLQLGVK